MARCRTADLLRAIANLLDPPAPPEKPGSVALSGRGFIPVTNLETFFDMAQDITDIRIRGDVLAYVSAGPVVVRNAKGAPMEPQPAPNTLTTDQTGLEDFYIAADGRLVIMGSDAKQPDDLWNALVSVKDGDADDLRLSGAYDPDAADSVDGGVLGSFAAITDSADLPARA